MRRFTPEKKELAGQFAGECGARNIALPARRDEKSEGGGKIMPDNPPSACRKMMHWNNQK